MGMGIAYARCVPGCYGMVYAYANLMPSVWYGYCSASSVPCLLA